jgi:hypothetical protein
MHRRRRGRKEDGDMVNGFKVTLTSDELRAHLAKRIDAYRAKAQRRRQELNEPDGRRALPADLVQHDIDRAEQLADAFAFMREHLTGGEIFMLGKDDLEFVEVLPDEQDDVIPTFMYRR